MAYMKNIIFIVLGLFLGFSSILFGIIIWKKQKVSFIHGKNKVNIKEEEIKGYTESMGKIYVFWGISLLILPLSNLFNNDIVKFIGMLISTLILIFGFVKMAKTEKKYKTGFWA